MPMFERTGARTGEGVYLDSCREVFRRGRRLDPATHRRMRDLCIVFLKDLGCDFEDISKILSMPLGARQCRNRAALIPWRIGIRESMAKTVARAQQEIDDDLDVAKR
jgi:hypothetical protein